MGIMTARTRSPVYRVISMGFLEGRLGTVMTAETERRCCFDQQVFFIGTVSQMTGRASLFRLYLMHDLLLVVGLLMTLEARLIPLLLEQMDSRRRVRIVTGNAFPPFQHRMHIRFVQPYFFPAVAGKTDLIAIFFQEKLGDDPVPQVAPFTVLLFDHSMNILHAHVFVSELLVTIEAILAGKPWAGLRPTAETPFWLCRLSRDSE